MQSVLSWPLLTALIAMGAVLPVVFLRSRRSTTGEVRLRLAANPKPQSARARGAALQRKSPGVPARFGSMDAAEFEAEMSALLRELGYTVRPAPQSGASTMSTSCSGRRAARWRCSSSVGTRRWATAPSTRCSPGDTLRHGRSAADQHERVHPRKAVKLAGTTGVRLVDGVEPAEWLARREERPPALPENDPEPSTRSAHSSAPRKPLASCA